jgi:hypothetical protein
MSSPIGRRSPQTSPPREKPTRWDCHCQEPPVLLATYDRNGRVNIKVRDRYWNVGSPVHTVCPRCGAEHVLEHPAAGAPLSPRI